MYKIRHEDKVSAKELRNRLLLNTMFTELKTAVVWLSRKNER